MTKRSKQVDLLRQTLSEIPIDELKQIVSEIRAVGYGGPTVSEYFANFHANFSLLDVVDSEPDFGEMSMHNLSQGYEYHTPRAYYPPPESGLICPIPSKINNENPAKCRVSLFKSNIGSNLSKLYNMGFFI